MTQIFKIILLMDFENKKIKKELLKKFFFNTIIL
jgi:hypothetical protein